MKTVKRITRGRCCGIIIDVQTFFLAQVDKRLRSRFAEDFGNLLRLLDHLRIPIVVTLEKPIGQKGKLPHAVARHLGGRATIFEKNFFDLSKEAKIRRYLARLKKNQAIVAGCETDVCVLHSCLGLLSLGYEVFVVEDLLFSSTPDVDAAMVRMRAEGAVFLTFKTLFYELVESVERSHHVDETLR